MDKFDVRLSYIEGHLQFDSGHVDQILGINVFSWISSMQG